MIEKWFVSYKNGDKNTTSVKVAAKSYKISELKKIGSGHEKTVLKLNDEKLCIFIPTDMYMNEESWSYIINSEKKSCDLIIELGLKAQKFQIVPAEIQESGKDKQTINVLLTQDFQSLCLQESMVIYNYKARINAGRIIGNVPAANSILSYIDDKNFIQKMFSKIIVEYAIAFTFKLPIKILGHQDDAEHFCLELPKENNEPPIVRYLFWDVPDLNQISLPLVPTKSELAAANSCYSNGALRSLARTVSNFIYEIYPDDINDSLQFYENFVENTSPILDRDDILIPAIDQARDMAIKYYKDKFDIVKKTVESMDTNGFVSALQSAISTKSLPIVMQIFELLPNSIKLPEKTIKGIIEFAQKYEDLAIVDYLHHNFQLPMDSPPKSLIVTPKILIDYLQNYTSGVEINKTKDDIDFSYGFCCFFKTSKAINREANYRLAQSIQTRLNSNESIATVFANVDEERNNIRKNIILSGRKSGKYSIFDSLFSVNLGIRSVKLNEIINLAKSSLKK
jgi:hypothetical protein